ncbi:hypothetical protein AVEN_207226-1 [Araneus ventricosus]|uniref:Uncharacterized protein n=1 Tax=Araneus ventricosus TaxID=182803 RepID=A0A4Y2PWP9_ARAVE|nr:hypothetical protein AVEN_207226-1 [Araneus ventricosus]
MTLMKSGVTVTTTTDPRHLHLSKGWKQFLDTMIFFKSAEVVKLIKISYYIRYVPAVYESMWKEDTGKRIKPYFLEPQHTLEQSSGYDRDFIS